MLVLKNIVVEMGESDEKWHRGFIYRLLKCLLNLLQYCFCFVFCFVFSHKACGILARQPGVEPALLALNSEVLTTGPPGKSLTQGL